MGLRDHYVAALKGGLLKHSPENKIIDVTHNVEKHNIIQAAFIVKQTYPNYPDGTVHIIGVTNGIDEQTFLAVRFKNQFFLSADNGIFSLICEEEVEQVHHIQLANMPKFCTFPLKTIIVPSANHLVNGGAIELLGPKRNHFKEMVVFKPVITPNEIRGFVQHIDSYGNLITNIRKDLFVVNSQNRSFTLRFRSPSFRISKISMHYTKVPEGEMVAIFGESNYLEVAINQGAANKLLGVKINDSVNILFHDN